MDLHVPSSVSTVAFVMAAPVHQKLWEHENPISTRTYEFKRSIEAKYGVHLEDYEELRQWSINHLGPFWEEVWHFTGIRSSTPFTKVGNSPKLLCLHFPRSLPP